MAGRAGRRGWDWRGNVVLFGMPRIKVMRLLSSHLPRLHCEPVVLLACFLLVGLVVCPMEWLIDWLIDWLVG